MEHEPPPPGEDHEIDRIIDYINRTNHLDNLKDEALRLADEVKRLRGRRGALATDGDHVIAFPNWEAEARWHKVTHAARLLLVHLTKQVPTAYPSDGQTPDDFARSNLAEAAAAALWELIADAMTSDNESHLEEFAKAIMAPDRIPPTAADTIAPVIANLIPPIVDIIKTTDRSPEDLV